MNAGQEDFDKLRKLLALKRHEQPPPGYFDRLPGNIISRIKAGETTESFWERFVPKIVLRPSFAYGFGLAATVMLAVGIGYALKEPAPTANNMPLAHAVDPSHQQPVLAGAPAFMAASNENVSSTNPMNPQPLFQPNIQVAPASFQGQNH